MWTIWEASASLVGCPPVDWDEMCNLNLRKELQEPSLELLLRFGPSKNTGIGVTWAVPCLIPQNEKLTSPVVHPGRCSAVLSRLLESTTLAEESSF